MCNHTHTHLNMQHTYTHTHMYIGMYVSICIYWSTHKHICIPSLRSEAGIRPPLFSLSLVLIVRCLSGHLVMAPSHPLWPDTGFAGTLVAATLLLALLRLLQWARLWWQMPPGPWGLPLVRTARRSVDEQLIQGSFTRVVFSVDQTLTQKKRRLLSLSQTFAYCIFPFLSTISLTIDTCISFCLRFLR